MGMAVQAHQLLHLQDWMDTNNNNAAAGFHESPQPQPQSVQNQNQFLQASSMGASYSTHSLLALQLENQRQEIDRFLALQNGRLRIALQEQRKQEQLVLLRRLESKTMSLLRLKDEEIAKSMRTSMELQDYITKVEMENLAWQRVAQENESMVIALNNTLEQVRQNGCWLDDTGAQDAESCCCESSSYSSKQDKKRMICKACDAQNSCVLFLPCRHLCCCKSCEALLDCCPVCKSVKKASIDVFMS